MIISPFTPLFFDVSKSDRVPSRYVQTFACEDPILVQCLCGNEETPKFEIIRVYDNELRSYAMGFQESRVNDNIVLWYAVIRGLSPGIYRIAESTTGLKSSKFRVSDDPADLANTTLIQYSMRDNSQRSDGVFRLNGIRQFFAFRVPGGFKSSDWVFGVDNEQFTDSNGDIVTLYSLDTVQKKFTLGGPDGVSPNFAELLNRILSCGYVYFDGVRYTRVGTSVPEPNEISAELDSFVYKVNLQRITHAEPEIDVINMVSIRKAYSDESNMTATIDETNYNILAE